MKSIGAAKFKENCLSILEEIGPEGLVITKNGKPVAKLIPFARTSADLIGSLKSKIQIKGDLLSTGIKWDAES